MTIAPAKDARLLDTLREAVDNTTVDKVFGAPIEQDGTIMLPVAKVGGGAGGGSGTGPAADGQSNGGTGGGLGMSAKPLGVFTLTGGKVAWHPAIDVNRVILGGQVVAVAALLVARALIGSRPARTGLGRRIRSITAQSRRLRKSHLHARLPRLPGRAGR